MLDQSQIEWIIKAKKEGKKNQDIASIQEVSVRRVQQLYGEYRRTGTIPSLKRAGRPKSEISEYERRTIIDAHGRGRRARATWNRCCLPMVLISATGRYTGC